MAITLKLREEDGGLVVTFDDQTVKTALEKLPAIDRLQADPFANGQVLTAALGGDKMLKRLADDPDNLILLDCDDKADAFAWEFATLPDRQFLCVKAGMLRTVPRNTPPVTSNGALNFIALAADPLVNKDGNPYEGYRLDLDNEMRSIRETLQNSGKNLTARRIPPTRDALIDALMQGNTLLHLSCHGDIVPTNDGLMAVLSLENNDGSRDPLSGKDLLDVSPKGALRLVMLSACYTATGTQANLARALAYSGVPITIGMQNPFPDPLSDDVAVKLYRGLFAGLRFGEALRMVRVSLARHVTKKGYVVGLPVGYVSANGWSEAFPIQQGTPSVGGLGKPGQAALGGEIQPPRPLLGRNLELHQIAKHFADRRDGGKVITVAGTGGMGKTALAAAFAERFAWMWTRGVSGYSFANEVNAANFRYALMRVLFGDDGAQKGASLSESQQREAILKAAREWSGLWLFDNYESIIQGNQENQPEAESIHRLIADLANGGADMLLTSREQPAGLKNERLFPDGNHALHGLGDEAGVELFFQHSVKAKEDARTHAEFALAVQRAAEGHPLAIALLAGEYDVSAVPMQAFLGKWQDELASARRGGLSGHHATFTIAFERSYAHLSKDLQKKLASLSIFPFPFFAHGAVMIWDGSHLPDGEEEIDAKVNAAQQTLSEFTRRSLLEVDANFTSGTPATYRFQPALRQEAARRLDSILKESQQVGYAAYGVWLANQGYGKIHRDVGLNRVVRLSMDAMEKATYTLHGAKRLLHIRNLAWLKNAWGETDNAFSLLNSAISPSLPDAQTDPEIAKVESALRFNLASICMMRGDLDRALQLYHETQGVYTQLDDKSNLATTLSMMASIYVFRRDFDRALSLSNEGLELHRQSGDKRAISQILNTIATIYFDQGNLDQSLTLYQESLQLCDQIGEIEGKAAVLLALVDVYLKKNDLDEAEKAAKKSLSLDQQLKHLEGVAFDLGKLGQIAQRRGEKITAIARYQEALAIHEKLGMPRESQFVREMIANIEGGAATNDDMLSQVLAQAREASQRGDVESAIQYQEQAVSLARGAGEGHEALIALSVKLYNLAGYYQDAERHDDAVKAMEEVVAIDEQTGHQDLESDRETLETFRRIASLTPEEREQLRQQEEEEQESPDEEDGFEAQLQAQLAQLPPERRAEVEAQIRKAYEEFQRMSPEEKAEKLRAAQVAEEAQRRNRVDQVAIQVRDAGLAYFRKQAPKRDVLNMLEESAAQMKANEKSGSPWLDVAELCLAIAALIKEESIPPVPAAYASHFSAVQSEIGNLKT